MSTLPVFLDEFTVDRPRVAPPFDLAALRRYCHTPGVGIATIVDGEPAEDWYTGERRHGDGEPVTAATAFQAGSISKSVAAAVVLRLVADGVLRLDDDVDDGLRSWHLPANGDWRPRVTVRQLLSHTAGTTVHGFCGYRRDTTSPTVPELLDGAGNTVPVRVVDLPGLRYSYSGGGYVVLQQLSADVTGEPFADLARRTVLDPLGMDDSEYALDPAPDRETATGHWPGPSPIPGGSHRYPELAACGLWSTPRDLARFLVAVRRSWRGEPGAFLPVDLATAMTTEQLPGSRYGLGLTLAGPGEPAAIGHGGDTQGFQNRATLYLESGHGAVIMTNGGPYGADLIGLLLPALGRHFGWPDDEAARATGASGPAAAEPAAVPGTTTAVGSPASGRDAWPTVPRGRFVVGGRELILEPDGEDLTVTIAEQSPVRCVRGPDGGWHAKSINVDISASAPDVVHIGHPDHPAPLTAVRAD